MKFNFFKRKKHNKSNKKSDLEYVDLAPIDDIPADSEYFRALGWAFNNEKVKNIAISGPYGSGKSSIIETYLKNNPKVKKQSINISMASFKSQIDENPKYDMSALEESFLKQLFYKVDYNKIPQSRYRKLHKISIGKIYALLVPLIIISSYFISVVAPIKTASLLSKIKNSGNKIEMSVFKSDVVFISFIILAVIIIANILLKLASKFQIKEVKLPADTKVDSSVNPDSIFNKNMDEIMYFFEATDYRYVFFEDLDRFNNIDIFVRLRELNTLINNYDNIRKKKHVRFIYALKDNVFNNEDRTKFFDFIIPVIPTMNSTNAADVLMDMLSIRSGEKKHDISQEYIFDVAPYITDMRVLQNIYNEFILYKKTLISLSLKDEEMMSLIVFKNICPKDFAELQAEKGIVKSVFSGINDRKKAVTIDLQAEINQNIQIIEESDKDVLKSKREIKVSMLFALVEWKGQLNFISVNNDRYYLDEIMKDSFDLNILNNSCNKCISYTSWNGNTNTITINEEIIKSYVNRWNNYYNEEKDRIYKRIEEAKNIINEINGYSLKKLIEEFGTDEILPDDVKENSLLTFMLRRGYINEKYANYINYFKGVSLTKDDMNFILSVKDDKQNPFDYSLTETETIIRRLQTFDFRSKAVLNYDLLESLLSSNKNGDKLGAFISQLSNGETEAWDFVDGFIDRCNNVERFIKLLSHAMPDMWEYLYNNSALTDERKLLYLRLILIYAEIDDIKEQNSEKSISSFIVERDYILQQLFDQSQEHTIKNKKMQDVIAAIGIKFKEVVTDGVPSAIIDFIFDNNYYEINNYMINALVKHKDSSLLDELAVKNYSTIRKLNYAPLLDYIHDNLKKYMDSVFFTDKNKNEDIESVIILIKEFCNDDAIRNRIIKHENFLLNDIYEFCGNILQDKNSFVKLIWDELLVENKVVANWKNINTYHECFGFSFELSEYISSNIDLIIKSDYDEVTDELEKDMITSDINDSAFLKFIETLDIPDFDIPFDSIYESKMKMLIEKKIIPFSPENYESMVGTHPELKDEFLIINQDDYIDNINEIRMHSDLLLYLIKNPQSTYHLKQTLISRFAINFMSDDLAQIIANDNYLINKEIFYVVWNCLDDKNKNRLFKNHFELLDCDDIEKCFNILQAYYPDFCDRTRRHDVKMKYSEDNLKLAKHLESIEYITSYEILDRNRTYRLFDNKDDQAIEILCRIKSLPQLPRKTVVAN